jgi:Na+/H+-translocating membrane pyrophosphatase
VGDSALFLNCSEYDRVLETALRYVEFNVDEIQHVACAAVGAQRCAMFKKLGEGMYFAFCVFMSSDMLYRILQQGFCPSL